MLISVNYVMFTYITTTTIPSFPQLQAQYGIDAGQVDWTVAIPMPGLAVGPLLWSLLSDIYGRCVILILNTLIALVYAIEAAKASNCRKHMAARFFQSLGVNPGAIVGLAITNNVLYEHQQGLKVGL